MHYDTTGPTTDEMIPDRPTGNLLFGPHGLRAPWCLLLYLAILLTPVLLLSVASHLPGTQAELHRTGPLQLVPTTAITTELFQLCFVVFATWIMARIEDRSVLDYGLQWLPGSSRKLAYGCAWGVLFMSLLIAILVGSQHLIFSGVLLKPAAALEYGAAWALNFCLVGLFEEFLFRGYLQSVLTRCFAGLVRRVAPGARHVDAAGFWAAAVLISFGFGFVHRTNPDESPIGLICAGLAGLLFAFSLWRTGTLWWAVGLHAAWDWAQSYLFGVADSGTMSAGHLLASHPAGSVLLSGGATGPEGSLFVLPVMALIALVIMFTLSRAAISSSNLPWLPASVPAPALAEVHSPRA